MIVVVFITCILITHSHKPESGTLTSYIFLRFICCSGKIYLKRKKLHDDVIEDALVASSLVYTYIDWSLKETIWNEGEKTKLGA